MVSKVENAKLFLVFAILCVMFSQCTPHEKDSKGANETVKIRLNEFVTDSIPFLTEFNFIKFEKNENFNIKEIDSIESGKIVFQADLQETSKGNNGILTLRGKKNGKEILIFDVDNDSNIANRQKYIFDEKIGFIKINNVDLVLGDTVYKQSIYVQPQLGTEFLGMNIGKQKLGLMIIPVYRYGNFKTNQGDSFKAALFNHFSQNYTEKNAFLVIIPVENKFSSSHPVQYRVHDTIYLNKQIFLFKGVSKRGDIIELEHIGNLDKNFGIEEGNFALKMKSTDILNGQLIEIGSSPKFTLLDFWGTWCTPCIELIDELKKVNQKFSERNFQMVSIAFDDSEGKVQEYLNRHEIEWTNLYDERKNSVIASKYKVTDFPTFILLNPEGKILIRGVGKEALQKIVAYLQQNTN